MRFFTAAITVTLAVGTTATETPTNVTWDAAGPFDKAAKLGFQCAEAVLPLCHDGVCNRTGAVLRSGDTVGLELARLAPHGTTAPAIWWISEETNPIASSGSCNCTSRYQTSYCRSFCMEYDAMEGLAASQRANIYLVHLYNTNIWPRFSGSCSTSLQDSPTTVKGYSDLAAVVAKCAAGLTKDAIPPASISLTNIARHVVSVLTTAVSAPVFVYARGRGTLVLRRLLQIPAAQKLISGYVFDNLRPPFLGDEDAGVARVGSAMLAACMADTAGCGSHCQGDGGDPQNLLRSIYREIDSPSDSSDCIPIVRDAVLEGSPPGTVPSHALRGRLAQLVTRNDSALVVPALAYVIHQCEDFQQPLKSLLAEFRAATPGEQLLQDRIVDFSERWQQPKCSGPLRYALQWTCHS